MRPWMVVLALPLLAGCTDNDWNRLLSFGGNDARPAAAATRPAPAPRPAIVATAPPVTVIAAAPAPAAAAPPNPFCVGIARQDATTQDFDAATQQKIAVQSYQQCMALYGN